MNTLHKARKLILGLATYVRNIRTKIFVYINKNNNLIKAKAKIQYKIPWIIRNAYDYKGLCRQSTILYLLLF